MKQNTAPLGAASMDHQPEETDNHDAANKQKSQRYGASEEEWEHFQRLGMTTDLLPVVSNPTKTISTNSTMKEIGKTPSLFNNAGHVVGIKGWTRKESTPEDVREWSQNPDLGICLQTRHVRAIDIDIQVSETAASVVRVVEETTGPLPRRIRANSPKCLLIFRVEGIHPKKVIRAEYGIIEFLGDGQQFIAAGTHPSGARYEWVGGLPAEIPTISQEKLEAIWEALQERFGVAPGVESTPSQRANVLAAAIDNDPIAKILHKSRLVLSSDQSTGQMNITCPWDYEHTTRGSVSATTYFPAHTGGFAEGHFKCFHAHCAHRTIADLRAELELDVPSAEDFAQAADGLKACLFSASDLGENPFAEFPHIVENWIPEGEVTLLVGHGGSGKSYVAVSIAIAVALGRNYS